MSISLEDLTNLLKKRHEKLVPVLENCIYAINMEYVESDYQTILVKEGDEVAVIPPVSGG
jgi:molybdopterin converting factor small subunit